MGIDQKIHSMSLEEKAALLSGKDFWSTQELHNHDIPSIFLSDGPHGLRRQEVGGDHLGLNASLPATCFPTSATLANSWNKELAQTIGEHLGREAVAQKISVILGPGINIKRNPLCGRNFEYFSEDPHLAGKMGAALIKGIQKHPVAACAKHFTANNQELRRMVMDSVVDERALREIYLRPFKYAVQEGKVKTVMSSYNLVNGTYANENPFLLRQVLRQEWGFDGVVVTDWGGNNDRVKALEAGNDLEMPTTNKETSDEIVHAVNNGTLDEEYVDAAVKRLLTLIDSTHHETMDQPENDFDKEVHHAMAQKAAEESIVLLKNERAILPLNKDERVAVIGDFANTPRYQGAGSSIVNPTRLDSPLSLIESYTEAYVGYAKGFKRYGKSSKKLQKEAINLARQADTVLLYIGLDEFSEAEGIDRSSMAIPANQIELIQALKDNTDANLVGILSCGSVIELPFEENFDAILHQYLSGQAGAQAHLNTVYGHVNPSGKLAETYPMTYEDVPSSAYFPGEEKTAEYRESLYVGYRYYDTVNKKVRYPFGFGLSYTTFSYHDLKVDDEKVSFTVENTGDRDGSEIAQVYVTLEKGKVFRPSKELKGFEKVHLKPKEKKTLTIPLGTDTFTHYDVNHARYEIESGEYKIMVGASSRDIRLSGTVSIKGTMSTAPYDASKLPSYYKGDVKHISDDEFETLLGKPLPPSGLDFYKKNRIKVDSNTPISDLKYSKRFIGRWVHHGIVFIIAFLKKIGKRETANTLIMGVYHQPLRGISRMSGGMISWGQLESIIAMFNGHFFKGLARFLKEGRKKRKRNKYLKEKWGYEDE